MAHKTIAVLGIHSSFEELKTFLVAVIDGKLTYIPTLNSSSELSALKELSEAEITLLEKMNDYAEKENNVKYRYSNKPMPQLITSTSPAIGSSIIVLRADTKEWESVKRINDDEFYSTRHDGFIVASLLEGWSQEPNNSK